MDAYISFLTRPSLADKQAEVFHGPASWWPQWPPGVLREAIVSAVFFIALQWIAPYVLSRLLPASFGSLPPERQAKAAKKFVSFMHHALLAPWAAALLWREYRLQKQLGPHDNIDYAPNMALAGFTSGYFFADFILALPHARASPDFFIHHLGILAILYRGVDSRLARFAPHLMLCELSSIFLDVMWGLKETHREGSRWYTSASLLFFLTFTATRVLNLPLVAWVGFTRFAPLLAETLGEWRWMVVVVVCVQFYWWMRIVAMLTNQMIRATVLSQRSKAKGKDA